MASRNLTTRFRYYRDDAKLGAATAGPDLSLSAENLRRMQATGMKLGRYLVSAAKDAVSTTVSSAKHSPLHTHFNPVTRRRHGDGLYTQASCEDDDDHGVSRGNPLEMMERGMSHLGIADSDEDEVLGLVRRRRLDASKRALKESLSLRGVRGAGESDDELAEDPTGLVHSRSAEGVRRRGHPMKAASAMHDPRLGPTSSSSSNDDDNADDNGDDGGGGVGSMSESKEPPKWMLVLDQIDEDLVQVSKHLSMLHKKRIDVLKIRFDESEQESANRSVDELRSQINRLFRQCQKNIILIGDVKHSMDDSMDHSTEKSIRLNAMRSRAVRIQDLTKKFRNGERQFMKKLSNQESSVSGFFQRSSSMMGVSEESILGRIADGMTKQELEQITREEQSMNERTKEILKVSRSVSEVSGMYKEMEILILESGSILDRIDYNVELTLDNLKASQKHIDQSERYQNKSQKTVLRIIMLLMVLVCICLMILIGKVSVQS